MAEAYGRKKLRYVEFGAEAEQRGWKVRICPVEVGCRGFVAKSLIVEGVGCKWTECEENSEQSVR